MSLASKCFHHFITFCHLRAGDDFHTCHIFHKPELPLCLCGQLHSLMQKTASACVLCVAVFVYNDRRGGVGVLYPISNSVQPEQGWCDQG